MCGKFGIETTEEDTIETIKPKVAAHTFEQTELEASSVNKTDLQQIALCFGCTFTNDNTKDELIDMIIDAQTA